MSRHVKNLDELSEFSPQMLAGVERAVQLVRPKHAEQCRRDVKDAVRMIASLPDFVPQRVINQQLQNITAKLNAAQAMIDQLSPAWRRLLRAEELPDISKRAKTLANTFSAEERKRSGGAPNKRKAVAEKMIAAEQAFDLLTDHGDREPMVTRDGEYYRLARMLIEIATGRNFTGDIERALREVKRNQPHNS